MPTLDSNEERTMSDSKSILELLLKIEQLPAADETDLAIGSAISVRLADLVPLILADREAAIRKAENRVIEYASQHSSGVLEVKHAYICEVCKSMADDLDTEITTTLRDPYSSLNQPTKEGSS